MALAKNCQAGKGQGKGQGKEKRVKSTKQKQKPVRNSSISSLDAIAAVLASAEEFPPQVREMLCAALPACTAKPEGMAGRHSYQSKILAIVDSSIRMAEKQLRCQVGESEERVSTISQRLQAMNSLKDSAAAKLAAQEEEIKSRTSALAEKSNATQAVKCVLHKAEVTMQRCDKDIGMTTMEREYIALAQKAIQEADSADKSELASSILAMPSVLHHVLLPPDISGVGSGTLEPNNIPGRSRRNSCGPTAESLLHYLSQPSSLQNLSTFLADRAASLEKVIAENARERVASFVDVQTASAALSLAEERQQKREAALLEAQAAGVAAKVALGGVVDDSRALAGESAQAIRALTSVKEQLAQLQSGPLAFLGGLALEDARAAERAAHVAREMGVRRRRCSWLPRTLAALRGKSSADSLRIAVGNIPTPGRSSSTTVAMEAE